MTLPSEYRRPCPVDEERLDAAIERADRPGALRARPRRSSRAAAPKLQRVLAAALAEGGWFGESHEAEVRRRRPTPEPDERLTAVRTLLAEEARMGMMVGVAVGWALAEELRRAERTRTEED